MLNATIISVAHMLSPLWSEQITKFFLLDYRYCTVFNLLFNGVSSMIIMSETTAMIVLITVFTLMAIYVGFSKRLTLDWFFAVGKQRKTIDFQTRFLENEHITSPYFIPTMLESFLYENSEFFVKRMPRWISAHDSVRMRNYLPSIESTKMFLNNGFYYVKFSQDIYFSITVTTQDEKKNFTRNVSVQFLRGDENDMFEFIKKIKEKKNCISDEIIFLFPSYVEIGTLKNLSETKGKRSTFFGYYNPKLDMLIDWIDSLQRQQSKCRQPRQFSILCHGKSGTGKTAIVKRIAEYTSRSILCVDLLGIKEKKELMNLFHNGNMYGNIGSIIFFIDELDKVIRKFKLMEEDKKKMYQKSSLVILQPQSSKKDDDNNSFESSFSTTKNKNESKEIDWNINDLLDIFCGSYVPDQRMIVATCNDLDYISAESPHLVRPGRLTPIKFDYGKKDLFARIVKDYTNIVLNKKDIPEDYVFIQAYLIEYLNFKPDVTEEEILKNLQMFRVV